MMGSGMPNSHSKIPLPMLIHSCCYSDNTGAQRFGCGDGSAIHVDERPDRTVWSDGLRLSSQRRPKYALGLQRTRFRQGVEGLIAIVRRTR